MDDKEKPVTTVERAQVNNGYVFKFNVEGDEDTFVYEEDDSSEESECAQWCYFLRELTCRFHGYHNKYAIEPININITPSPGRGADTVHHVRAFLEDLVHAPKDDLINAVTKVIEDSFDNSEDG